MLRFPDSFLCYKFFWFPIKITKKNVFSLPFRVFPVLFCPSVVLPEPGCPAAANLRISVVETT